MLSVHNVWKWYNKRPILQGVRFGLKNREIVGLIGPSGSGKSVLLKTLGGVLLPDRGRVRLTHHTSGHVDKTSSVGFLFQEGALFDSMSVVDNVAFPMFQAALSPYGRLKPVDRERGYARAGEMLGEVGLLHAAYKMPGQLSGGMRRRVALARALVTNPDLLLLDDPTGGLDPVASSVILELIAELHGRHNPTVIMVSHDLRRLLPRVQRVLGIFDGVLTLDCQREELVKLADDRVRHFISQRYDLARPSSG